MLMKVKWFVILFLLSLANARNPLDNELVADHLIRIATIKRPSAIKYPEKVVQLKKCKKNLICMTWLKNNGCTTKSSLKLKKKCPIVCSTLLCKDRTTTRKPNKPMLKKGLRMLKKRPSNW